jgi:hypothetical protein
LLGDFAEDRNDVLFDARSEVSVVRHLNLPPAREQMVVRAQRHVLPADCGPHALGRTPRPWSE